MNWWEDPEKVKQRAENYKKNFLKKHGVENPQQVKEIKVKTNNTLREKYGCVGFDGELGEKSRVTTKSKYGVSNIMKHEDFKFKGDDNPVRRPEVKKKISKTLKGRPSPLKGRTYEEILGKKRAKERRKEQVINGVKGYLAAPRTSRPQLQLYELVKEKYPTAVLEYPIFDYCLDIAVPELKLCFEYDGSYWHDAEKDKIRAEVLERHAWTVKRFVDEIPTTIC